MANIPLIPHDTWSGKSIRLKGTSNQAGANIQYSWDFGDGSPVTAPAGGFYLVQTDPDSDVSVYFSSDLTIRGGGEPVIPEPGTLTLLGLGLADSGAAAAPARLAAGRQPDLRGGCVPAGPRARLAFAFQEPPMLTRRRSA